MEISLISIFASFVWVLIFVVTVAFYMFFHREDKRIKTREFPILVCLLIIESLIARGWARIRAVRGSTLFIPFALTTIAVFLPELVMIPSMFAVEMSAFSSSRLSSFGKCIGDDLDIDMSRRVMLDVLLDCFSRTSNIPHQQYV